MVNSLKRIIPLFVYICAALAVHATVTIRFYDNGRLAHTATELDNAGDKPVTGYYDKNALERLGFLKGCSGYTFVGWCTTPVGDETIYNTDAAAGMVSTINIGTTDINLYSLYRKDVSWCYRRITSMDDLAKDTKYLIVAKTKDATPSYYAMKYMNRTADTNPQSAVYSAPVTPIGDKIYAEDVPDAIWNIDYKSGADVRWQSNLETDRYIYINYQSLSGIGYGWNYICRDQYTPNVTMSVNARGEFTFARTFDKAKNRDNGKLYFTKSTGTIFDPTPDYNMFFVDCPNNRTNNMSDDAVLYLYKHQPEKWYISHCTPYTVNFHACGDNSCGESFSVSPTSITQTKTIGADLLSDFSTIDLTSLTTSIGCTDLWTFAGWATEPCAKTYSSPTLLPGTTYNPLIDNIDLYAVYRHKTNGTPDYWSSYPSCTRYTVTFHPGNGTVSPTSATETDIASGVLLPEAVAACSSAWIFKGYVPNEALVFSSTEPANLISVPNSTTRYYPADDEDLYAVYLHGTDRWSTFPVCDKCTVTLDPGTGTVPPQTTPGATVQVAETEVYGGVTLPSATSACSALWTFEGWAMAKLTEPTATRPTIISAGTYYPTNVSETLYAVYRRGRTGSYVYSSVPDCDTYTITLNVCGNDACDANIDTDQKTKTMAEVSAGAGITMPAAVPECPARWTFVGWQKGSPVDRSYTAPTGLYAENSVYYPTQNDDVFYAVYGHNTSTPSVYDYFTSNPSCDTYRALLNACEGTLPNGLDTMWVYEESVGSGITLPAATPLCTTRGWSFKGWIIGGELGLTTELGSLTIYEAGDTYTPISNNTELYAVYEMARYREVTATSELNTTNKYVIAFRFDYNTSYPYSNFALTNRQHPEPFSNQLSLVPIERYYNEDEDYYYISEPKSYYVWTISSIKNSNICKFQSAELANNNYLHTEKTTLGTTTSAAASDATWFTVSIDNDYMYRTDNNGTFMYFYFQNENLRTFHLYQNDNPDECHIYYYDDTYYASWPHCIEYTVYFDGCDGMVSDGDAAIKEDDAGKGITLPTVTDNCTGWDLVGWADQPVADKTSDLNFELYAPGTVYIPLRNNHVLYAVYAQTKSTYTKLTSLDGLHAGMNYVIVGQYNSTNYALSNIANTNNNENTNRDIQTSSVTISGNTITSPAAGIIWRLQLEGEDYVWYNLSRERYLDMRYTYRESYYPYSYYYATHFNSLIVDAFEHTYVTDHFEIKSIKSNSYLYFYNNGYTIYTIAANTANPIQLYRQDADYWSYPCSVLSEAMRWDEGSVLIESVDLAGAPTKKSATISSITDMGDGTYKITHTAQPGTRLRVEWGGTYYSFDVPFVITRGYFPQLEYMRNYDLVVASGSYELTKDHEFRNVTVYDGASLILYEDATLTVDNLILYAVGDNTYPTVTFGNSSSAITINPGGALYHDRRIPNDRFYFMSLPFSSTLGDLRFSGLVTTVSKGVAVPKKPTYYTDYYLQYYDGVTRATDADAGKRKSTYWTHVVPKANKDDGDAYVMQGGQGYNLGLAGSDTSHPSRTFRFKMTPSDWNKYENGSKDGSGVTYTRTADVFPSTVTGNKVNAGWNLIGNPYLHTYHPGSVTGTSGLLTGYYVEDSASPYGYRLVTTEDIAYLTVYNSASDDYTQYRSDAADAALTPFSAAFVQIEENNVLQYTTPIGSIKKIISKTETTNKKVYTGLALANEDKSKCDYTGLVISDQYTNEYEIGGDLAKWRSGGLSTYSLSNGVELAFNALSTSAAEQSIPIGVVIPCAGKYTFSLDQVHYAAEQVEHLLLTDHVANVTVDLKDESYTFNIAAGVNNTRFALAAFLPEVTDTPTDEPLISDDQHVYASSMKGGILVAGMRENTYIQVYDTRGALVVSANAKNSQYFNLPAGVYLIKTYSENKQSALRAISF